MNKLKRAHSSRRSVGYVVPRRGTPGGHSTQTLVRAWTCATFCILFFTTTALAQTAPTLGTSGSFAVLAGSTVTNTGATDISGDIGVSPGSSITGFPPGVVTSGTLHAADAVASQAQADLLTAFGNLSGQQCNTDLTGQDLAGMTLTAKVYCFSGPSSLTGALTLDAQGNPAAVFIFQVATTLTTSSNASVAVINGGSNCNVFWQLGSSATLGSTTSFAGTIFAQTSITLNTGAMINGRLLAANGAVTLDTNTISLCSATTPVTLQMFEVN